MCSSSFHPKYSIEPTPSELERVINETASMLTTTRFPSGVVRGKSFISIPLQRVAVFQALAKNDGSPDAAFLAASDAFIGMVVQVNDH
jgi:hypothetical protein